MRSAVIIVGHERRFSEEADEFARYLRRDCGIRYVASVAGWNRSPIDMECVVSIHALRAARQPFLLAYIGHGWHDGWYYGQEYRRKWLVLKFAGLSRVLRDREGPTLIVSDTCRAASIVDHLKWSRRHPQPLGVIAATSPKGTSVGQLSPALLASWRQGIAYVPRRRVLWTGRAFLERRWGAELDHLFFPKPA